MKIRTDFVTNSSSSSFVSYQMDVKLLKQVLERSGIPFRYTDKGSVKSMIINDRLHIQYDDDASPPQLLMILLSQENKKSDIRDTREYEQLDGYYAFIERSQRKNVAIVRLILLKLLLTVVKIQWLKLWLSFTSILTFSNEQSKRMSIS